MKKARKVTVFGTVFGAVLTLAVLTAGSAPAAPAEPALSTPVSSEPAGEARPAWLPPVHDVTPNAVPVPAPRDRVADSRFAAPTYSDAIAARLGVVDGKAILVRQEDHTPGAPADAGFETGFGGHGVTMRLRW